MSEALVPVVAVDRREIARPGATTVALPEVIVDAGPAAVERFLEFFAAAIANDRTRAAYGRAAGRFLAWCGARGLGLRAIAPLHVAAYIRTHPGSVPTVKQHLAAIRALCDWLVVHQVLPVNPAAAVRGPKHVVTKGATPVLMPAEARALLDRIDTGTRVGLRDRALLSVMVYSFARVSAAVGMRRQDYFRQELRGWLRLHEKGGKRHDVPAHHRAEEAVEAYLAAAGGIEDVKAPLFQSVDRAGRLSGRPLGRRAVLAMIKRRALAAGLPASTCCHTFRATGITAYLSNGGTLEHAQRIAGHSSPKTTKLYDRTADTVTLDEIERIVIFALAALAVAQPLFELLSREPAFFVARNTTSGQLTAFVVCVSVALPLALVAMEVVCRRLRSGLGNVVHVALLTMLGALFLLPLLKRVDVLDTGPLLVAASLLAGLVAVGGQRVRVVGSFLTALVLAAGVVPIVFLANAEIRSAVLRRERAPVPARVDHAPPIVLVVFDEFPTNSLLDRNRTIDRGRYPHLARLADGCDVVPQRQHGVIADPMGGSGVGNG